MNERDALGQAGSGVGNTPLVKLNNLLPNATCNIYAKLEMLNPSGSMKDRSALNMITSALERGDVRPGGLVIESSSGNMGKALARVCKSVGISFICVVDERTSPQNIAIMQSWGARIEKVQTTAADNLLEHRIQRVEQLLAAYPGSYWPNQYNNPDNPCGYEDMMREIDSALHAKVDVILCATGTCGTIRGCYDYLKKQKRSTQLIAVDAEGSVIFGGSPKRRMIPGHGSAQQSPFFTRDMAATVIPVAEQEAIAGCHELLHHEKIMAGGSSGAIIGALRKYVDRIPSGANVVLILADKGESYADTIYNQDWVKKYFPRSAYHAG